MTRGSAKVAYQPHKLKLRVRVPTAQRASLAASALKKPSLNRGESSCSFHWVQVPAGATMAFGANGKLMINYWSS